MPTAKFAADFTDFNTEVNRADANLRTFTGSSDKAERNLRLVDGTNKVASNSFGQLSQGLGTADRALGALGVHIGPEIRALEELSVASGKTASQIGLIGSASLVAAAALGGWEIGRTIAKFFDLDKTIGDATARLLGYGDVAGEIAGAQQDSINRAIKDGADANIKYGEAVRFNVQHAKDAAVATKAHATELTAQAKAAEAAADAERRLAEAEAKAVNALGDRLIGTDAINDAQRYMKSMVDVRFVTLMTADAQKEMEGKLAEAQEAMARQGNTASDLFGKITVWRQALLDIIPAAAAHGDAIKKMETDEERFARENDELAKAMKDNFVIIGNSAQEAARKVSLSWNEAIEAAWKGQGTLGGQFQSIAAGTPGSTVRYDDYGNPYGYIPGVNQPGRVSATGGGTNIFNFQDSYFDTPADQQRLASKVTTALGSRAQSLGG